MPLANCRDKITQVKWAYAILNTALAGCRKECGCRKPRSTRKRWMCWPRMGSNSQSLRPARPSAFENAASRSWQDVSGDRVDPSRAYLVQLPSKRAISVFFYDGPISQGVAFERLLDNGQRFADRFKQWFFPTPGSGRSWSTSRRMVKVTVITTVSERWHFPTRLHHIETNKLAQLTNYGEFLERHPADHLAEIVNNSSWSCVHGVERWRTNCGCNSGGHAGWNQEWRAPLRAALDWLRDETGAVLRTKSWTAVERRVGCSR